MPHGLTYIESKGKCIYCGDSNTKLTKEHIVPESLGGVHIIREASCYECATITSRFECNVAQGLWGDARTAFNAPTKRKKQRKNTIHTQITRGSQEIEVPSNEYPGGFVFYKMKPPGILLQLPEDEDTINTGTMVVIDDGKRREDFFMKYGSYPTLSFRHNPHDFARMIAKIAYGHILTFLELEDFNPICLPYILGEKSNISYVVGGVVGDSSPILDTGYSLSEKGFIVSENRLLLIAIIRLYANTHSPEYEVVVGDVLGFDNITKVIKKIT